MTDNADITDPATLIAQLSDAAQVDANQIDQILTQACEDINAILAKYNGVSLAVLSRGRNAVPAMQMYMQQGMHPTGMAPSDMIPLATPPLMP